MALRRDTAPFMATVRQANDRIDVVQAPIAQEEVGLAMCNRSQPHVEIQSDAGTRYSDDSPEPDYLYIQLRS